MTARKRSRPKAAALASMLAAGAAWRITGDHFGAAGYLAIALVYGLAVAAVVRAKSRRP